MTQTVWFMPTMDCEPPKPTVSDHANTKSVTGPTSWEESEAAIRGYVSLLDEYGHVPTLFVHPEVAAYHDDLFRELDNTGVCLGLHLHPYKFDEDYRDDLGAYPEPEQRSLIADALEVWESALGTHPRYFRGGVFSANDSTIGILEDLGFTGGSLSDPGRVKPTAQAVWAGAEPYPHHAHRGFRLLAGDAEFVEVPYLGDFTRPVHSSPFDREQGYETIYLDSPIDYDRPAVTRNLIERFRTDTPAVPTLVPNTHNRSNYSQSDHPSVGYLRDVMATLDECESTGDMTVQSATIETIIAEVNSHDRSL